MPNLFTKLVLFAGSYSPLWVILAIRYWDRPATVVAMLSLTAISLLVFFLYLMTVRRISSKTITISSVKSKDADLPGYLLGYLLPFLDIGPTPSRGALALVLFGLVVGLLYIHSNLIYVNPLFAAAGYHLYDAEVSDSAVVVLSKRRSFRGSTPIRVFTLGESIYVERS